LEGLTSKQGRERGRDAIEHTGRRAFLLTLDFLPLLQNRLGIGCGFVAEDMRVPPDHFFANRRNDLLERESTALASHLRVHDDMEQQVAEFLTEVRIIGPLDGIDHLVAFLDEKGAEAGVRLFTVPRTAVGCAKPGDDFLKAGDAV
jgi:hypothetical protein